MLWRRCISLPGITSSFVRRSCGVQYSKTLLGITWPDLGLKCSRFINHIFALPIDPSALYGHPCYAASACLVLRGILWDDHIAPVIPKYCRALRGQILPGMRSDRVEDPPNNYPTSRRIRLIQLKPGKNQHNVFLAILEEIDTYYTLEKLIWCNVMEK